MHLLRRVNMQAMFDHATRYLINILILYIIFILVLSLGKTLLSVTGLFPGNFLGFNLPAVVSDILTFLVMIELFRGFIDYFKARRFRLHSMMDPAILFVVRELIVKLYSHEGITVQILFGFSALILALGLVRTLAVCFSPEEETIRERREPEKQSTP
jgi:uncharacterized membrane protein (DUF373 family)